MQGQQGPRCWPAARNPHLLAMQPCQERLTEPALSELALSERLRLKMLQLRASEAPRLESPISVRRYVRSEEAVSSTEASGRKVSLLLQPLPARPL